MKNSTKNISTKKLDSLIVDWLEEKIQKKYYIKIQDTDSSICSEISVSFGNKWYGEEMQRGSSVRDVFSRYLLETKSQKPFTKNNKKNKT